MGLFIWGPAHEHLPATWCNNNLTMCSPEKISLQVYKHHCFLYTLSVLTTALAVMKTYSRGIKKSFRSTQGQTMYGLEIKGDVRIVLFLKTEINFYWSLNGNCAPRQNLERRSSTCIMHNHHNALCGNAVGSINGSCNCFFIGSNYFYWWSMCIQYVRRKWWA